ncbi:MDV031.5 [Gallid alphaherpesvirus 2]|uniref:MDV031.5 n=1 Tax=Gallid alphaherpesvirus 2 TaxID=10390 RepID=Q19BD3_9ALPH|nr:hypothetical protein MDV031.5 [Gallid alphaherpesvirus 2]ACF49683.1 hypothetical protein MDV031.5 [synthetic construct]ABR13098.1 hypothetical protein MDV031.5 [Gallid alphaherpesvirus 2]ACF94971.1 hypothetical protein MDV031.5 [Gallid alphaherpesvirus 2]ACR02867.1 hypothetical protein MDV031.5 [synthetic construct]
MQLDFSSLGYGQEQYLNRVCHSNVRGVALICGATCTESDSEDKSGRPNTLSCSSISLVMDIVLSHAPITISALACVIFE